MPDIFTTCSKEVLCNGKHYADADTPEIAREIADLSNRCFEAESLLASSMVSYRMAEVAVQEAAETFGYLHAVAFGVERHLKANGWIKDTPLGQLTDDQEAF